MFLNSLGAAWKESPFKSVKLKAEDGTRRTKLKENVLRSRMII